MYIILEGHAQAVYEDQRNRNGKVSEFSRKSIRKDLPQNLRFGSPTPIAGEFPVK
jgi:hypothetical protein